GDRVAWRRCRETGPGTLVIDGTGDPALDAAWAQSVLGAGIRLPAYADPVMRDLATRYPGLRPYCDGSIFDGIITAIVGQSISVAAAAVTQAKLAALFADPVAIDGVDFRPLPHPAQLADASAELVRSSGVTWRRAEALIHAAREMLA